MQGNRFQTILKLVAGVTALCLFFIGKASALPPVFTYCPSGIGGSHCSFIHTPISATSLGGVTYKVTNGVGRIDSLSGGWSHIPSCNQVGNYLFSTVTATNVWGETTSCTFPVIVENNAPVIISGCGDYINVFPGKTGITDLDAASIDCDATTWSIGSITPTPTGALSIDSRGTISFMPDDSGDAGNVYVVEVIVTDCAGAADTCSVLFDVFPFIPYELKIEKTIGTIQGQHEYVDVTLERGTHPLLGFDLLISFDASALQFVAAIEGEEFYALGCEWEYFTYRYSVFGTCGNACASGKIRVTGIAEINNGTDNHPSCFLPSALPAVMLTLDFLVSDNLIYECQYLPIRFVWFDCGDNTIANQAGDTLFISRYVYETDSLGNIADSTGTYPTWFGVQRCDNPDPAKPDPVRFIDFHNGGIDIICSDSIDRRGDINLNGISNEAADAVLFSNYFVYGLGVFNVNLQKQIKVTDVNIDGITLSAADLVFLNRVVIGDANPFPTIPPPTVNVRYTIVDNIISVDTTVAAAALVVEGNVVPTLLVNNMNMLFNFDGINTNILVCTYVNRGTIETFSGNFIDIKGELVSIEFGSRQGGMVSAVYSCCAGSRGNVNSMEGITVGDLIVIVNYFFRGGSTPLCTEEYDINGVDGLTIADLTYFIDYLFTSGPPPPACP